MKRIIALLIVVVLCGSLILASHASTITMARSKMSEELLSTFDSISANETVTAIVEMTDVDHDEVMATFAKLYPEEFVVYIRSKFDNLEDTEYASILTVCPFSQYTSGEIDGDMLQSAIEHKRAIYQDYYSSSNQAPINSLAEQNIEFISSYAPLAIAQLTESSAIQLCRNSSIVSLSIARCNETMELESESTPEKEAEDRLEMATYLPLLHSITQADYVRDTRGNSGAGVKIGVLEGSGIPDVNTLYLQGSTIYTRPGETNISNHATLVTMVMAGKDASGTEYGSVPDAIFYCCSIAHDYSETISFNIYPSVEWLVDSGVNVINLSAGWVNILGRYTVQAQYIDHLATQHDIHFTCASGNDGSFVCNPAMAYNAITVGAINPHLSTSLENFTYSEYTDYMEFSPDEDFPARAEKPNLVAPTDMLSYGGTSLAAPQVAGIIAQLCSYNASLKTRQALVGAVLAASSAEKVEAEGSGAPGDWFQESVRVGSSYVVSDREGAGIINARWARGIIQYGNAWSYTVQSSSFPYSKTVTIDASANSVTRVAIFWLQRTTINHSTNDTDSQPILTNLTLEVYGPNGTQVGRSALIHANFEIVQFTPGVTGTYTIKIIGSSAEKEHIGIAVW